MGNAEDSAETRERLLRAAIDLYSAKGFSGTSVQDVVHKAGLTKGAFYHHFESKAHLIMAIQDRFLDLQIGDVSTILARGLPPRDAFIETIRAVFVNIVNHKASVSLFVREYPSMPDDVDRAMRARRQEFEDLLVAVVDAGRETGEFHSVLPTNVLIYGIMGMCAWATHWYDAGGALSPEVIGKHYAHLVLDGLAAGVPAR